MSQAQFRNVDGSAVDPVDTWPYEALVAVIDRGLVKDWQPIFAEIRQCPWGTVTRSVSDYLGYRETDGVSELFRLAIDNARSAAETSERHEVARRISDAIERSGLTSAEFAIQVGTSASRLSTYRNGHVVPSAAMMIRIEQAANRNGSVRAGG